MKTQQKDRRGTRATKIKNYNLVSEGVPRRFEAHRCSERLAISFLREEARERKIKWYLGPIGEPSFIAGEGGKVTIIPCDLPFVATSELVETDAFQESIGVHFKEGDYYPNALITGCHPRVFEFIK